MTKLPSIARRPSGFSEAMEQAILKTASALSANGVKAVIEQDETADGYADAKAWLDGKGLNTEWVWWALERRDVQKRTMALLGNAAGEVSEDPIAKACAMLRKRYVYGSFRNEVYDRRAKDWLQIDAMNNLEAVNMPENDKGVPFSAFALLKRDRKAARVHNERYLPGSKQEIVEHDGVSWLNTWEPTKLKAIPGDVAPFVNHILYFCSGRQREAEHILDWFAFVAQNPGKKINHALLLISPHQGTGKDTMAEMLAEILGHSNVSVVQDEDVNEGRYDFMRRAQIVVVPETMGGDRRDLANKLKPLITQPLVRINEKHVKAYSIPNTSNFVMFSNYKNAAYIEDKDRRYFVIICEAAPRSIAYFDDLYDNYIRTEKMGAFLDFLLKRDLSKFNPYAPAPDTPDKTTVKNATMGGGEAWLQYQWESNAHPFDKNVVSLVDVLAWIQEMKGPRMTIQDISRFLAKQGGGDLGKRRVGGKQPRLWAVRDFEGVRERLDRKEVELTFETSNGKYDAVSTGEKVVAFRNP